jgi:hypothetical protein
MIMQAMQSLTWNREVLANAQVVINESSSTVSSETDRIEGARKAMTDARSTAHESTKSQRAIEADILAAQSEDSEYAKANLAFNETQQTVNVERDRVLNSVAYLKQKSLLAKDPESAVKGAKMRQEALGEDIDYQVANDKFKAAALAYSRIKTELFKASPDWAAASQAARDAHGEEGKANSEATRGALKKMPAARNLREANEIAAEAQMNINQALLILRSLNVKVPDAPAVDYSSPGSDPPAK